MKPVRYHPLILALIGPLWWLILSALIAWCTVLAPSICWPPRVGGAAAALAVLAQGWMYENSKRFQGELIHGITTERLAMHTINFLLIVGAILGAFGDLMPSLYGVELCPRP
jgi:hypothetical protein